MNAAAHGGLHVPAPVKSKSRAFLHVVDDIQIDVLTWLAGNPVGRTGEPLETGDRRGLFHAIGREMAKLHNISSAWVIPNGFERCKWDREGVLGEAPVWGRFWDNPTLTTEDRTLFLEVRAQANEMLKQLETELDYGLIHADLVRENVLLDGDKLQLIDFDDSGFGFRLFDLATTLLKNQREPDYPDLRAALLEGYASQRPLGSDALDLFLMLRSLTYVGWIITRLHEEGSDIRNARFVSSARSLAEGFLKT
jgi:Ser/Thr protein kinase RdoA (MazF antagonist)